MRVNQDALPVELMDFSIDETTATQAGENGEAEGDRGEHGDTAP